MNKTKKTVYVAMSGGVDSSVAAALLKKRGYRMVGVYFKPWSPLSGETAKSETSGFTAQISAQTYCNWKQDRLDAMRVAAKLKIPFKTWDFSKEYGEKVAQYMIDGYKAGITPNPDVMCNKEIKFGLFLKRALAEGADYVATGHYARIQLYSPASPAGGSTAVKLYKAKDANKDQTYFLWTLTQKQLLHCLFPVGGYTKPQVRGMARTFGLPTADKKDSQGVCFVGELNMKDFLEEYIKPKRGEIRLLTTSQDVNMPTSGVREALTPDVKTLGTQIKGSGTFNLKVPDPFIHIGTHDGTAYYTVGQRHGMNITAGGGPYYVARKDIDENVLYVTTEKSKIKSQISKISDVNWICERPKFPLKASVQIRYQSLPVPAEIMLHDSCYTIYARRPLVAVAPGQSAVIYQGDEVLGGGIIL